jgi:hypothetical protein
MTNFRISGRVIHPKTKNGIAGLRVEAWDKDLIYNDLVGSAITSEQGAFQIEFDESDFRDIFLERSPDLFFKLFHNDRLIGSSEDSVLWNLEARETEVSIQVEVETNTTQNGNQQGGNSMTRHGQLYQRDMVPPRSKYFAKGKFGRLFPTLPPFMADTDKVREALMALGKPGGIMDPGAADNPENPNIPAGFTFLGQFIDHDLTFDPTSSLERQNDPESIDNFRTPMFELDNIYGSGIAASPHLYDGSPANRGKFLIEKLDPGNPDSKDDLPRNSQNTALIGDPRNDENTIVSQLHLAFLKFHNAVVDKLKADGSVSPGEIFAEAQRLVRWHYQWIVLHEFLPHTVGKEVVKDILKNGRKFYDWRNEPFIPVEFAVAAYRFGHSQVRPGYGVNDNFGAAIFDANQDRNNPDPNDLSGGKRAPRRFVKWSSFFEIDGSTPQTSKRIDTTLSGPLFKLPFTGPNLPTNPSSLAQRNLLRHLTFSLPSGQTVARAMRLEPLTKDELADVAELGAGLERRTPLWFYILREADKRADGKTLGPVGGRIVAEVFIGLLEGDRMSYLMQEPDWTPTLGSKEGEFGIVDLLKVAGVA